MILYTHTHTHTTEFTKRICIILLAVILIIIAILAIADTYSKYYARAWAVQKQDVGKWQVKLNNLDIYSKNGDAITFEMDATTSSTNTSPGKIAPGSSVYSDITLDPTGTDVAVRYDITIDFTSIYDNGFDFDLVLQNAEGGENGATSKKLIQTDINTYTGVLSLDEIKKGTQDVIRVAAKWVNDENNNDADSQKGSVYGTNFQIPVEIACTQYLGEEIAENKLGIAINAEKYGWKVKGYSCTDENAQKEVGAWRLFYQSNQYTYLISDNLIESNQSLESLCFYAGYKTGADVSIIGQNLNPMLKQAGGFTSSNTNSNMKGVACLTDPAQWLKYTNEDSLFAIGAPTVELFAESFKKTAQKENREVTWEIWVIKNSYNHNTSDGTFNVEYNHGIYIHDYTSLVWLSSPSINALESVMEIWGGVRRFSSSPWSNGGHSFRPIVCMKTSVFQVKYAQSLVDE